MNQPITWGTFVAARAAGAAFGVLLVLVLSAIAAWQRGCPVCSRRLHFRWRKPHALARRRFCPFHDDSEVFR